MALIITIVTGGMVVLYLFLRLLLSVTQDAREPPAILTSLPFIEPVMGMIKEKERFHLRLRDQYRLPIYTLRLPFQRIYIVNETKLIPALQKHWRHVSFSAIAADAGAVVGMSKEAVTIMHEGLSTEEGFSVSWPRYIMSALGPGKALDAMNRRAIEVIASETENLRSKGLQQVELVSWSRKVMAESTTEAVWGPQNPYRDSAVAKAWGTFEAGFLTFSMFPGAKYLFPKLLRARELVASALIDYTRRREYEKASGLVKMRYKHHVENFGLKLDDFARGELGNTFAVLGNTVPCSMWMIWHVFSDEKTLTDIRKELTALVDQSRPGINSIDLTSIHELCPVLLSTFQEVLRYRAVNPGPRVLLEDVFLEDSILLKKGSMLMIPAPVQHFNHAAWGDDAGTFDHLRFAKNTAPGKKKFNRVAFRAFGGGHQLCPGRHFASTEIMALAALLVLQFDIVPTSGKWVEPTWKNSPVQAGFPVPDEALDVKFIPRDPTKRWNVEFVGSKAMMGIVAEDISDQE